MSLIRNLRQPRDFESAQSGSHGRRKRAIETVDLGGKSSGEYRTSAQVLDSGSVGAAPVAIVPETSLGATCPRTARQALVQIQGQTNDPGFVLISASSCQGQHEIVCG